LAQIAVDLQGFTVRGNGESKNHTLFLAFIIVCFIPRLISL